QHDGAEDAQDTRAVHACSLQQLARHSRKVVAEDQGANRNAVNDVDQDQARYASVETNGAEELKERDQDALVRDEHAEQKQGEDGVGAAELPLRENIPVERAEQRRENRRRRAQKDRSGG